MAICVQVKSNGLLELVTGVAPAACPHYVVMDSNEYATVAVAEAQLNATMTQLVAIPDSMDFAAAWSAGFVVPMAVGLASWAVAKLVNYFN